MIRAASEGLGFRVCLSAGLGCQDFRGLGFQSFCFGVYGFGGFGFAVQAPGLVFGVLLPEVFGGSGFRV